MNQNLLDFQILKERHTFDKFWSLDINSQAKYEYQAVVRKVPVHKWCPSN